MPTLIRIGYWRSEQRPALPHPSRFVDPSWDVDERDLTIEYQRGGLPVVHMMGYSACRMCELKENGTSEFTDGTYLWPQGLAHYVQEHEVRLPAVFAEHAVPAASQISKVQRSKPIEAGLTSGFG